MNSKIIEKIKKCLRLSQSDNANEAAIALKQAQKLMQQHGISHDDIEISDISTSQSKSDGGRTPPEYIAMLANMVSHAFGSRLVYSAEHNGQSWTGYVRFYGANGADEVSAYAFEVLGRHLKRDRTAFIKTLNKRLKRTTKTRRADLYCKGWVTAVSEQVVPQTINESTSKTLDAYASRQWPDIEVSSPINRNKNVRSNEISAYGQGFIDGDKVEFHQGVKGTQRQAIGQEV